MNKFKRMWNRAVRSRKRVSSERLRELRKRCEADWIDHPDVIGVGQNDKGIVVFKTSNYDSSIFYSSDRSFDAYTDSPLTVIETEPFSATDWGEEFDAEAVVPTKRTRPIYGGLSIGHKDITCGTLAMVVQDKTTKELLLLSNNHVLANSNKGVKSDAILQPGPIPDGGTLPNDVVGYLERYVPLKDGVTVDCAVAKPVSDDICRYGMLGLGDAWFVVDPLIGMNHEKTGRTTGFTTQNGITAIGGTMKVNYGDKVYKISDVFVSQIKSAGGDSGAPICERYTAKLIGLLFAGNGSYTIACKATNVFKQLGIELMERPYGLVLDLSHYNGHLTRAHIRHAKAMGVQGIIFKMSEGGYD